MHGGEKTAIGTGFARVSQKCQHYPKWDHLPESLNEKKNACSGNKANLKKRKLLLEIK